MFNLLRAECYKLRKSKNLLICALVVVGMTFLIYGMLMTADKIINGDMENGTAGVIVSDSGEDDISFSMEETNAADVLQQFFSGNFMEILLACFASIIIVNEYGSGAIKNIVGKGYSRESIFLARFLSVAFGTVLLLLLGVAANLAGAAIVIGKGAFYPGVWKDMGIYTGLQAVMCISMSSIYALIAEIERNTAGAISTNIGIVVLSSLLAGGLDMVFARWGFKASEYWPMSISESCPISGFEAGGVSRSVVVSLLWIAVALAAGIWHFQKADIK